MQKNKKKYGKGGKIKSIFTLFFVYILNDCISLGLLSG